jgi:hypothetical protein
MEVMVAGVVLLIAVIGTSSYRYHAALGARHADLFSTGVRITLLLCEGWSGEGGSLTYDPVSTFSPDLDIADGNTAGAPTGFTELGSYEIIVNDFSYYATLSWKNMGSGITSLHVVTRWGNGAAENAGQSYRLTTYVKTGS